MKDFKEVADISVNGLMTPKETLINCQKKYAFNTELFSFNKLWLTIAAQ